ncbi:MAG: hypothetical protein DRJ42_00225 [Deltaproteobacteria bacterium]|nr:MAG: hypothetical protein DRJ42_00225 [Deltaproteobacteria bacterium]
MLSHRVEFLLIGGHALAVHAQARFTEDLDVFVDASPENAARLLAALRDFGFGAVAPSVEELATKDKVFMLGEKPYRIDVLTTISGVEFSDAWRDRVFLDLEMGRIPTIDRQSFIRNKRASGRPKDLADLAMLEASEPDDG